MILSEKIRPTTLDNIKLQDKNLDAIIQWANSWQNGLPNSEKPALLLHGTTGIGKTTIARCLCEDLEWILIELNASDARNKELLSGFTPQKSLSESVTCILFDEIDSLDSGGEQYIKKIIKSKKFPCILTANNQWKIQKEIKSLCEIIQIYRPSVNSLKTYLQEICQKENLNPSKELLEAASLTQDYRLAINMIEADIILSKPHKKPSVMENTKRLILNDNPDFSDCKSLLYNLDENCYRLYDPLDLHEIYKILSRCDQLRKRGQIKYANDLLKTIPKSTLESFELYSPVFKKDEKSIK